MKHLLTAACLGLATLGLTFTAGCEREVAHEREVEVGNGEATERETTIRETPNGGLEREDRERHLEQRNGGVVESEEVEVERIDP